MWASADIKLQVWASADAGVSSDSRRRQMGQTREISIGRHRQALADAEMGGGGSSTLKHYQVYR